MKAALFLRSLLVLSSMAFVALFIASLIRARDAVETRVAYQRILSAELIQEIVGPGPRIGWRRFYFRRRGGTAERITWVGLPLLGNGQEVMVNVQVVDEDGALGVPRAKARWGDERLRILCVRDLPCTAVKGVRRRSSS